MISITNFNQPQNNKQNTNPLPTGLAANSRPKGFTVNSRAAGSATDSHQPGFTIIEVVLVLAIAGLIFLMVFIALPALQRNQRDTQRKNDLSRLKVALESYKANNRGNLPSNIQLNTQLTSRYLVDLDGGFNDPDGSRYVVSPIEIGRHTSGYYPHRNVSGEMMRQIFFVRNARCANGTTETNGGTNNFAVLIQLEGGGNYCIDG